MTKVVEKTQSRKFYLDTLGQVGHEAPKNPSILKVDNLRKRARSKWFTQAIVGRLLYMDLPLHKYYQRAYYCNHQLKQHGKTITARYCDTRVCHVCNRIRTAKMMRGYMSQLGKLDSLEFVTLTLPNVDQSKLLPTIEYIQKTIVNVIKSFRRRGIQISGVRKLEVTYNANSDTYHPHLHMIVNGYGRQVIEEWLKRVDTAVYLAQDVRPADQNSLNELFKYTTKILGKQKNDYKVYLSALDNILFALKGKRCFQPFGIIRKVDEEVDKELEGQVYEDIQEYPFMIWEWNECDWQNPFSKDTLTGYISPDVDIIFVE